MFQLDLAGDYYDAADNVKFSFRWLSQQQCWHGDVRIWSSYELRTRTCINGVHAISWRPRVSLEKLLLQLVTPKVITTVGRGLKTWTLSGPRMSLIQQNPVQKFQLRSQQHSQLHSWSSSLLILSTPIFFSGEHLRYLRLFLFHLK